MLTSAQARTTPTTLSRTAETASASLELLDWTSATATATRLATQASTTQVSVDRERLSSSASSSVRPRVLGQPIAHTHTRAHPAATDQPVSGESTGDQATPTRAPATTRRPGRQRHAGR